MQVQSQVMSLSEGERREDIMSVACVCQSHLHFSYLNSPAPFLSARLHHCIPAWMHGIQTQSPGSACPLSLSAFVSCTSLSSNLLCSHLRTSINSTARRPEPVLGPALHLLHVLLCQALGTWDRSSLGPARASLWICPPTCGLHPPGPRGVWAELERAGWQVQALKAHRVVGWNGARQREGGQGPALSPSPCASTEPKESQSPQLTPGLPGDWEGVCVKMKRQNILLNRFLALFLGFSAFRHMVADIHVSSCPGPTNVRRRSECEHQGDCLSCLQGPAFPCDFQLCFHSSLLLPFCS